MSRILIVDDEKTVTETLSRILKRAGHTCFVAGSATEARDIFESEQPDTVLLDILMPYVNGISVLRDIKKHARSNGKEVRIIIITGSDEDDVRDAMAAGADLYLKKPLDEAKLRSILGEGK